MITDGSRDGGISVELERIQSSVSGLVTSFATDGYIMRVVSFDGELLRMAIDALEGVCAECLVPPNMMTGLVRTSLPKDLAEIRIEIDYPTSH